MDTFKEFQGKDLDDCIAQSCDYYDCPREKLEIEIIQDAKSGIFGIVGARKAKIRARRVKLSESVQELLETGRENRAAPKTENGNRKAREPRKAEHGREKAAPRRQPMEEKPEPRNRPTREEGKKRPRKAEADVFDEDLSLEEQEAPEGLQFKSLAELDQEKVKELAGEAVAILLRPIAGREVSLAVEPGEGFVCVKVDWEGDAGLLIGREGQTLAALQYLASRIISHGMNAALKVQLDIGDYRHRQEEKLCRLAKSLAEKACAHGKSFSTRPLSSYQRRIIHICLQDNPEVQTRSSGEGPFKRVLIFPKRQPGAAE